MTRDGAIDTDECGENDESVRRCVCGKPANGRGRVQGVADAVIQQYSTTTTNNGKGNKHARQVWRPWSWREVEAN